MVLVSLPVRELVQKGLVDWDAHGCMMMTRKGRRTRYVEKWEIISRLPPSRCRVHYRSSVPPWEPLPPLCTVTTRSPRRGPTSDGRTCIRQKPRHGKCQLGRLHRLGARQQRTGGGGLPPQTARVSHPWPFAGSSVPGTLFSWECAERCRRVGDGARAAMYGLLCLVGRPSTTAIARSGPASTDPAAAP